MYTVCELLSFAHRYLLCYLIYTNGQRQGNVISMTISQVKSAESVHKREESFYRIRCWEHNTTQSFGSANVVVLFQILTMLLSYVDSVRAEATDDDLVFPNPVAYQEVWPENDHST